MEKYKFKTKPYKHQYDCWMRSRRNKYYAYLMEMGTGKSKVTLDVAAYMYDQGWINAMIIFANKGSYENWLTEHIPTHLPGHINYEVAIWRSNLKVKEKKKLENLLTSRKMTLKILIMNIEALPFQRSFNVASKFTKNNDTMAVVDESTTIKNPKAKRTKAAFKIGKLSKARRILTGSPVDNRPLDIWAQYEFLCPGLLGHTSYYSFRAQYAELQEMRTAARSFKVVVGYKNLDRLRVAIAKYAFIIKSEDCLDLPPKIYEKYN